MSSIGAPPSTGGGGASTAADVSYDNGTSGLTATDAQAAIDEVADIAGAKAALSRNRYDTLLNSWAVGQGAKLTIDKSEDANWQFFDLYGTLQSNSGSPASADNVLQVPTGWEPDQLVRSYAPDGLSNHVALYIDTDGILVAPHSSVTADVGIPINMHWSKPKA